MGAARAAGGDPPLLDTTLRAESRRTIAVGEQDGLAVLEQLLGPVPITRLNRLGMASKPAASMQRDHARKRAIALRLVKLCVEHGGPGRNLDRLRPGQWRRKHGPRHSKKRDGDDDR